MALQIVVAMGANNEIGYNNQMPWHLPEDLKHFKELTINHPVLMGKNTFLSIGKPLVNRKNIVISKSFSYEHEDVIVLDSIDKAITKAKSFDNDIMIIGGASIYAQTIDFASVIHLTLIDKTFKADTFFPTIDKSIFELKDSVENYSSKNDFYYYYQTYVRK